MQTKRNLGVAALATMLSITTFAGVATALERAGDRRWQVAPGSLGAATNAAKDWIQPQPNASP